MLTSLEIGTSAVADADLQIGRAGPAVSKNFFLALRVSVWCKKKGPPGPSSASATALPPGK